jgi:hypothetical protein
VPASWAQVGFSDADELGLPFCEAEEDPPAEV